MSRADLNDLKARVDLAEVVRGGGVELKKKGKNLLGRCPFHPGDREPSLCVNPETQLWNCFGCEAGGDVIRFLELAEKLEFPQAVERLRQLAAVAPPEKPHRNGNGKPAPAPLPAGLTRATLLGRVMEHYQRRFRETPEAQQYLVERGLGSRELWDTFRVGYVDGTLLATLPTEGPVRQALSELGILNPKGGEHFRGCLVVPLEHPEEGLAGLYGRAIAREATVRHLYLPGPKRGVLQPAVLRGARRLWLTESVLDAFSLWVAGVRDVSCLFGVSGLPADLEAFLGRSEVQEVVLCLDGDRAGQEATAKLSARLAERGLSCRAVTLPAGQDPNELLGERGPAELRALVENPPVASAERVPSSGDSEEKTADGFRLRLGDVVYTVTPQPPFSGRLRALVVAQRGPKVHSDSQNLHANRGRGLLALGLTKRLELPPTDAERHVSQLLSAAMRWVASFEEQATPDNPLATPKAPELTPEERAEALAYLRRPDLVGAILADCNAVGYVGEDKAKLLGYLIGLSRKLPQPLSGIIRSQSGAGKSALTELIEKLTPPEDVRFYSRISPQVLYFLDRGYLKHTLLIVEERAGGEGADYPIRSLQSRQKLSLLVTLKDPATGKLTARQYEVEGPIAYLETTTHAQLNPENASRCFELHLDETEEQTRRIQEWQREHCLPSESDPQRSAQAICACHHNLQRMLEPVCVFIPYARLLSFPSRMMRTRRDNKRFLSLIEVVAFLHQHQRERGVTQDGSPYVLATKADYRLAYELAQGVLAVTLHELSKDAQELWEAVGAYTTQSGEAAPTDVLFSRRELREFTGWQDYRLRVALSELVEMEYLVLVAGQVGKTYLYRQLLPHSSLSSPLGGLTTPEQLDRLWPDS